MPLAVLLGHEHRHRPAEHLVAAVAEHSLGGAVEVADEPILPHHHDAVGRVLDDLAETDFRGTSLGAKPLLLGQVLDDQEDLFFFFRTPDTSEGDPEPACLAVQGADLERQLVARLAGGHHLERVLAETGGWKHLGELSAREIVRSHAEHLAEGMVREGDYEILAQDEEPRRDARNDLLRVGLRRQQGAPVGVEVRVDGEAHVEKDNFHQCLVGVERPIGLVRVQPPDRREEPREVLAVGAYVPLWIEAHALVSRADPEAIGDVVPVVRPGRQPLEVRRLRPLDAAQRLGVLDELARLLEQEEVLVEALDKAEPRGAEPLVQLAQQLGIALAELEERLPTPGLAGIHLHQVGHGSGGLLQHVHGPTSGFGARRPGPSRAGSLAGSR
jgi:hypothetical protein